MTELTTPRLILRRWRDGDLDALAAMNADPRGDRLAAGAGFWGAGIATEAARVVLRFGFDDRGLDRIISIRHVDNRASGRVMDKIGLRFDRMTVVPAYGQPVEVRALTRGEYLAGSRTQGPD